MAAYLDDQELAAEVNRVLATPSTARALQTLILSHAKTGCTERLQSYRIEYSYGPVGLREPYGNILYFDSPHIVLLMHDRLPLACVGFELGTLWHPPRSSLGFEIAQIQGVSFKEFAGKPEERSVRRALSAMHWEELLVKALVHVACGIEEISHLVIKTAFQNGYYRHIPDPSRQNARLQRRYDETALACGFRRGESSFELVICEGVSHA